MNLLEDPNIARDWKATIGALAGMTPLVKQFPWLHDVTNWVPGSLLGRVSPKLGRIIRLKQVSLPRWDRASVSMESPTSSFAGFC